VSRDPETIAEQVRQEVVRAALSAYEDAAMRGLCCEGAWEVAVAAMRRVDLTRVLDGPLPATDH
jgi:hypothetical protein